MTTVENPTTTPTTMTSEDVTAAVLSVVKQTPDARQREVMTALVRHLHDFAREVRLTPEELLAANDFLTRCGQISSDHRHEFLMLSDTLGFTMCVDTMAAGVADGAFESSVLGPFYRADAPEVANGGSISHGEGDGEPTRFTGTVTDLGGTPIPGAVIDLWGTAANGLYENIDPDQPDYNLRGKVRTRDDGTYEVWTAKPVSYPVPDDGPAGQLLYAMERHNMRPGHLHVIVSADGFKTVVSELFVAGDPYLDSDAVFGVKPSLIADFEQVDDLAAAAAAGIANPFWSLAYDFRLTPGDGSTVDFSTGAAAKRED